MLMSWQKPLLFSLPHKTLRALSYAQCEAGAPVMQVSLLSYTSVKQGLNKYDKQDVISDQKTSLTREEKLFLLLSEPVG